MRAVSSVTVSCTSRELYPQSKCGPWNISHSLRNQGRNLTSLIIKPWNSSPSGMFMYIKTGKGAPYLVPYWPTSFMDTVCASLESRYSVHTLSYVSKSSTDNYNKHTQSLPLVSMRNIFFFFSCQHNNTPIVYWAAPHPHWSAQQVPGFQQ